MKIKNISCEQFAGIRDKDVCFEDGINIIYGQNESGKSTLVNLLSRTLFQNAHVGKQTKEDKDFRNTYLPSAHKDGSAVGNAVDGKVTFETEKGEYTISKGWGADEYCKLYVPNGNIVVGQSAVDELKEALNYGEGVYSEMLFSSQSNTGSVLQTLLDSKNTKTKQEIINVVSAAFVESNGVTIDNIEQAIQSKIDGIAGKHWDTDKHMPAKKSGRWAAGLGEILTAYYALEDAKSVLDKVSAMENEEDCAIKNFNDKDKKAANAQNEYDRFDRFANKLATLNLHKKRENQLNTDLKKLNNVFENWPKLDKQLTKAKALQKEKSSRECLDNYASAKKITEEIEKLQRSISDKSCPDKTEIQDIKNLQREISWLENKLCGMNVNAAVNMLGNNSVEITSLITGKPIDAADNVYTISETVRITIPGVMEMQLSPADVNVSEIEAEISEKNRKIAAVFEKYSVKTLEQLEQLSEEITSAEKEITKAEIKRSPFLIKTTYDKLKAEAEAITEHIRGKEEIDAEILLVCGSGDVQECITRTDTLIDGYKRDYVNLENLRDMIVDAEKELKSIKEALTDVEDIPEEYMNISDSAAHLESLKKAAAAATEELKTALVVKTNAVSALENYEDNLSGDPRAEKENAERKFNETKNLLAQWMHIQEVFYKLKEEQDNNPMSKLAASFMDYLGIISGGKISSEFQSEDKLDPQIYSGDVKLDYGKLSEGTKETVSLAFRLAVLDELFPTGGGVIVLDDPFTDMDAERAKESCELLKKCAAQHQVIFLTCREDYLEMLGGNVIRW